MAKSYLIAKFTDSAWSGVFELVQVLSVMASANQYLLRIDHTYFMAVIIGGGPVPPNRNHCL